MSAEAHVDVFEICSSVLGDVFHRLAEGHEHGEPGRADEPLVAVGSRVAGILGQRIRRHRELGEGREEAFGDGFAALVAEDLTGFEVFQKVASPLLEDAGILDLGHGEWLLNSLAECAAGSPLFVGKTPEARS